MSIKLYDLEIIRTKLMLKPLREITLHDIVPVRETLQSIDFILGNDDKWEYARMQKGWRATTKVRLYESKEILKFIEENKDKLRLDSIDHAFLTDLTKVYKIVIDGTSEQALRSLNKEEISNEKKNEILEQLRETVTNLNSIAKTMGDILWAKMIFMMPT